MREEQCPREGQFCLLGSLCPRGLHAQHLRLGIPSPAGGAPALVTFLGEPRFLFQEEPSSQHWARETECMASAIRRSQPQHGQESPGNSSGQVDLEKRVPLDKRARGANTGQRRDSPSAGSPRVEDILSADIPGSWHKIAPCMGNRQDTTCHRRKRRCPSWNNRVGRF